MRVFITGGSGLIGGRLAHGLAAAGHLPVILSRHSDLLRRKPEFRDYQIVQGDPATGGRWQHEVDGCDAVVNLAGHNIFAERWSPEVKRKIRDSRVYGTEGIVAAIRQARNRPGALVQASAIGIYGSTKDEELSETSPSGSDFLAVVCREWEQASEPVEELGVRRAIIRTGVVLAPGEGALGVMTPLFRVMPGTPIGSDGRLGPAGGNQWMSWIHVDDIVGIYQLAVERPNVVGPINATSPNPVRNRDFARTLTEVLRKPYTPWRFFIPIGPPDGLLKLMLGEVAGVVVSGQKVLPVKAANLGYAFRFPELRDALRDLFKDRPKPAPAPRAVREHAASHH